MRTDPANKDLARDPMLDEIDENENQGFNGRRTNETPDANVIPVIEEQVEIRKRTVETARVRIVKTVEERDEVVDLPGMQEQYEIERVPINRQVDSPVPVRYEGDLIIVPILEEVAVVQTQLMLKEELHLRKRTVETHAQQSVRLRKEHVEAERIATNQSEIAEDTKGT